LTELTRNPLAQAACSVHLLGEKPGITVDDGDEPISHLQYRLALAHRPAGFTQVVWAPASLQPQPGRHKSSSTASGRSDRRCGTSPPKCCRETK
jgi:hypothetical protein